MGVVDMFLYGFHELLQFFAGFIIGSMVDVMFFNVYKRIDPKEESASTLAVTVCVQLFLLVILIKMTFNGEEVGLVSDPVGKYFLRLGLISSQIFLLKYAMKRFGKYLKTFGWTNPVISGMKIMSESSGLPTEIKIPNYPKSYTPYQSFNTYQKMR